MFSSFFDLTLWQILTRLAAFMILVSVHGLTVALLLKWTGDMTPVYQNRKAIEPFRHLSLLGLLGAVLFKQGWMLPMPFDPAKAVQNRGKIVLVVLVSLAVVLALVPLFSLLRPRVVIVFPLLTAQMILAILDTAQDYAIWFAAFNILPLPPLTGFLLLAAFAPKQAQFLNQKPKVAELAMLALIAIGAVRIVTEPLNALLRAFITY